jgi:peptide/nickel transport system permease protein
VVQVIAYGFLSLPAFFVAMVFLFWASRTGVLPLGGMQSPGYDLLPWTGKAVDLLKHLAIPTVALSFGAVAALQRIMRGNMLDVLGKQYILAARARGLSETRVIYGHALRNAINPLLTLLGFELAGLLSGAALMEIVTSWPGLGTLMLTAVRAKDIYLVMASMMMGGVLFVAGNLIADILLAKADPRIRMGR